MGRGWKGTKKIVNGDRLIEIRKRAGKRMKSNTPRDKERVLKLRKLGNTIVAYRFVDFSYKPHALYMKFFWD